MATELDSGVHGLHIQKEEKERTSSSNPPKEVHSGQQQQRKNKAGGRKIDSPTTQLSKALAYLLRHGTIKEGLQAQSDGFVLLDDILARPKVKKIILENGNSPSFEDVYQIVNNDNKKRFEITQKDSLWYIRAVQGHSIANVVDLDHIPITLDNLYILADKKEEQDLTKRSSELPEGVEILHGTSKDAWEQILQSGGLSRMKRNHIHLAKGRPGSSNVISGMRSSSQIIVHIDIISALKQGDIPFSMASNGAILTSGQGDTGILPIKFLTKAELGKTGKLVWQNE